MPLQIDYEVLEELSKGEGLNQLQNIFVSLISELIDYLKLNPLYQDIKIMLVKENLGKGKKTSILDLGVERIFTQKEKLLIRIYESYIKFLPFILLREAYYSFLPKEISKSIKICINQIIENDLSKLIATKEWKKVIRDLLVDRNYLHSQFDKLQKFFKIEAKDPFENSVQFFLKDIRENALLIKNENIKELYDLIFERYSYKTSKSLFNKEIIETLYTLIQLFYDEKSYLSLFDYQILLRELKDRMQLDPDISIRKFIENLQWINKCSSIAPSYEIFDNTIDLSTITCFLKFNPLLEKNKIKKIMEEWPFIYSPKFSENTFAKEISLSFIIPKIYISDLLGYFNKLKSSGYIIEKQFYLLSKKTTFLNLNYFTDISNTKRVIDPSSVNYKKKYEIEHNMEYLSESNPFPLSMFDFVILDRVKNVSVTGLTFDKRIETLNAIKEDIENELRKQINFIKEFKNNFNKILLIGELRKQFLQLLDENQSLGFFYLYKKLHNILTYLNLIQNILSNNPEIDNVYKLKNFLDRRNFSQIIEENLIFLDRNIEKIVFHDFIPLFFKSSALFRQEVEKIVSFYNLLDSCYNLKIFNINDIKKLVEDYEIKGSVLVEKICEKKESRIKASFKSKRSFKITNQMIESTIDKFLNLSIPVIKPYLINTILTSTFAKYYPIIVLEDTVETREKLKKLKIYFPRIFIFEMSDLITRKRYIWIQIYCVNIIEKEIFISILNNSFNKSILLERRYFWRGMQTSWKYQLKDFYDFQNKRFFYIKDFFEQLFVFSQGILGNELKWPKYQLNNKFHEIFWSNETSIENLVITVKNRVNYQNVNFNLKEFKKLMKFLNDMEVFILDHSKFAEIKVKKFFQEYIHSINFVPRFRSFNFSQYHLYIRPFDYTSFDFRILFINSFQKIKYPGAIESNQIVFCSYLFPFRTPNKSYLNWYIKSKKKVSEYCLFYKKKFYEILHFTYNLTKDGWDYSSIRFKSYVQNVLFNPSYEPKIQSIREFDFETINDSDVYGPESKEFNALSQIYKRYSIDIKSYIGTKKYTTINYITDLLKKKLIFPYLSLKNLDFQDRVSIILPNVKKEFNEKIIKIFSFFNMCHIHEIEGEFYIYGFEDIITFENGFLIEIWFPKCEMDEFFEVFDLIFQYFEIKHYLILTDLIDGKHLLKSVYGNLEFLDSYNPLKNLIWNDKDKIWMNHKLFNEKFEPIYPDLLYGEKKKFNI